MNRPNRPISNHCRPLSPAAAGCCHEHDPIYDAEHQRVRARDRNRLAEIDRLEREHAEQARKRQAKEAS